MLIENVPMGYELWPKGLVHLKKHSLNDIKTTPYTLVFDPAIIGPLFKGVVEGLSFDQPVVVQR